MRIAMQIKGYGNKLIIDRKRVKKMFCFLKKKTEKKVRTYLPKTTGWGNDLFNWYRFSLPRQRSSDVVSTAR